MKTASSKLLRALAPLALLTPFVLPFQEDGGAATRPANTANTAPRSVFLVRHAEKAADPGPDPVLSEPGRARAEALAHMLGDAGVTHLFCTEYQRTRLTLEPLAAATGVEVEPLSARDVAGTAERLRALPPGAVAVVAGHSNTVPAIARALGGELSDLHDSQYGEVLSEEDYDRLPLLILPAAAEPAAHVLELNYGAPDA